MTKKIEREKPRTSKLPLLRPALLNALIINGTIDLSDRSCGRSERAAFWILEGWCELEMPEGVIRVSEGQLVLFNPQQVIWYKTPTELSGYWVRYSAESDILDVLLQNLVSVAFRSLAFGTKVINIEADVRIALMPVMEFILRQHRSKQPIDQEIMKQYFRLFFLHVCACMTQAEIVKKPCRGEALTKIFLQRLEASFRTKRLVTDYAEMISVSSKHLTDVLKKTTGYSAGYHIRQRIAIEAKHEATAMGSSMKKIAYDLGFYDLAHFSRFFKNATGCNFSSLTKGGSN